MCESLSLSHYDGSRHSVTYYISDILLLSGSDSEVMLVAFYLITAPAGCDIDTDQIRNNIVLVSLSHSPHHTH